MTLARNVIIETIINNKYINIAINEHFVVNVNNTRVKFPII